MRCRKTTCSSCVLAFDGAKKRVRGYLTELVEIELPRGQRRYETCTNGDVVEPDRRLSAAEVLRPGEEERDVRIGGQPLQRAVPAVRGEDDSGGVRLRVRRCELLLDLPVAAGQADDVAPSGGQPAYVPVGVIVEPVDGLRGAGA
ncbi:MAG: hypothetical protein ACOCW3_04270 [Spirochaetota bacterium]